RATEQQASSTGNDSTPAGGHHSPPQPLGNPRTSGSQAHGSARPGGPSVRALLDLLAPADLVDQMLNDWFKYAHPLAPILHRRDLLHRLHDNGQHHDPVFTAMVVSVISVTISTLRRRSVESYPAITLQRCICIIEDHQLLELRGRYTLDWCIAWYHLASARVVDFGYDEFHVYRAIKESMAGVNYLLCYDDDEQTYEDKERLKRLYWLLYMWQVASELRGQPHLVFLPFNQDLESLRPRVIADSDLYPAQTPRDYTPYWPEDDIPYVDGFGRLVDVFLVWEKTKVDMAYKPSQETLLRAVRRIQSIMDDLPPEIRWQGGLSRFPRGDWGHEVQMVNILITALSLKSNLLQHLGSTLPGLTQRHLARIVRDVLEILDHVPQSVLETNGYSVVMKIRDIGAAYLAEMDVGMSGQRAVEDSLVLQLLAKLDSLDLRPTSIRVAL
ncbi:hypothetical protein GMORB2_2835, partial [Geosmithia morbida]